MIINDTPIRALEKEKIKNKEKNSVKIYKAVLKSICLNKHIRTMLRRVKLERINEFIHASPLCIIIDDATKRYIKPHQVHIGSHLAHFILDYVFNGKHMSHKFCYDIMSVLHLNLPLHLYLTGKLIVWLIAL